MATYGGNEMQDAAGENGPFTLCEGMNRKSAVGMSGLDPALVPDPARRTGPPETPESERSEQKRNNFPKDMRPPVKAGLPGNSEPEDANGRDVCHAIHNPVDWWWG